MPATLGWGDVQRDRDAQGRRVICGLKLRTYGNTALTVEDSLTTDDPSDDPSDDLKANNSNSSGDSLTTLTTHNSPKLSDHKSEKNQITDRDVVEVISNPIGVKPKKGDRVKYIGTKFQQLCNLPLIIHRFDAASYGVADCRKPDGSFTSWIPFADLKLTGSDCNSQGGSNA